MKTSKKIIAFGLLALLSYSCVAQNASTFKLEGRIIGLQSDSKIHLVKKGSTGKLDTIGTAIVKDEMFGFIGEVFQGIGFYHLQTENSNSLSTPLILINSQMQVTGNLQDWPKLNLQGSPEHTDYIEMQQRVKEPNALRNYVKSHPESKVSPFFILVLKSGLSLSERLYLYKGLHPETQKSSFGTQLKTALDFEDNAAVVNVGQLIPNISMKMADGSTASVRKLASKNKITLIDFWASWCKPCRMSFPHLAKMYKIYHSKGFGIMSLSQDENPKDWKKAMKEEKTSWMHALDVEHAYKEIFNISGIPAYIMVDQEGKILAIDFVPARIEGELIRGEYLEGTIKKLLKL